MDLISFSATLGTPHRRTIYLASLEAHTDRLHSQMLVHDLYPCHIEELEPFQGLNCKTAKVIEYNSVLSFYNRHSNCVDTLLIRFSSRFPFHPDSSLLVTRQYSSQMSSSGHSNNYKSQEIT